MEVKALVIDDEPLAQNVIQQYAQKLPNLVISGTCSDAVEAHQFLKDNNVDLLFLDINMPKLSGIAFLRSLKNPPLVIFTTAYTEYALDGFELNAIDYLKKPFSFERFCKAFFRAEDLLDLKNAEIKHSIETDKDFIFIKSNKKAIKVHFSEINFIEGLGDYIKIHTNKQKIVTNLSMKKMLTLLPSNQFFRIHKSFIVCLNKIEQIEGNLVKIQNSKIPVGNNYRTDFFKFLNPFFPD